MGRSQARSNFAQQPRDSEDDEKPTFLFGALARSQLVDPIEGDHHFESGKSSLEKLLAGKAQDSKVVQKRAGFFDDADDPASTQVLDIEKLNQEPGEKNADRITITLQDASAPAMQTMSAPNYLPRRRDNQAIGREDHRRAQAVTEVAEKIPVTSRESYGGLKILPNNAYQRIRVPVEGTGTYKTMFQCNFVDPDGVACPKSFPTSTSLVVHYQRHIDLKPFSCSECGNRFTQTGTLVRH